MRLDTCGKWLFAGILCKQAQGLQLVLWGLGKTENRTSVETAHRAEKCCGANKWIEMFISSHLIELCE